MEINQEMILSFAGAITIIGGAWLTIRKIVKDSEKQKEDHANKILQEAKEEVVIIEKELLIKIALVDSKIENLERNVEKDLEHLRQAYANDIKALGDKIELLRDEVRQQSAKTLDILTTLVNGGK